MQTSGTPPFAFAHRDDLRSVPQAALALEEKLHGTFTRNDQPGQGELYYALAGCGVLRVAPDMAEQSIIELPPAFRDTNFHSTRLIEFEGQQRLVLAANLEEKVVVVGLDGTVDYVLDRPEFEEYSDAEQVYKPTDTALVDSGLLVADGYGSNYIMTADLTVAPGSQAWQHIFGGKTEDPHEHGKFGTAHGIRVTPDGRLLSVADRLHARLEQYTFDGAYQRTFAMPADSRPCGIDYCQWQGQWYAAVGSLDDPDRSRPAPIYILDGASHAVISTIRPKEELGIERADHIHNVTWHMYDGALFLICQSWNPGFYFVLELQ